jgi:hypothetical protein
MAVSNVFGDLATVDLHAAESIDAVVEFRTAVLLTVFQNLTPEDVMVCLEVADEKWGADELVELRNLLIAQVGSP